MQVLPGRHVLFGPCWGRKISLQSSRPAPRQRRRQSVPLRFDPNSPLVDLGSLYNGGGHANLLKGMDATRHALRQVGLLGLHAKLIVMVDDSGSMGPDWAAIQRLLVRLFGFGLLLSPSLDEAQIPMLAYGRYSAAPITINVHNYQQANQLLAPTFGTTPMAGAYEHALELALVNGTLTIIINLTDGVPDNELAMTNQVVKSSGRAVILKNVALKSVPYLDTLDVMPSRVEVRVQGDRPLRDRHDRLVLQTNWRGRRLIDNVSSVAINPYTASDLQFALAIAQEIKQIIEVMGRTGILTDVPNVGRRYWYFPGWGLAA